VRQAFLALLLISFTISGEALELQEGLWQLTVRQTLRGMPVGNHALHYQQCLTRDKPIPTVYLKPKSCDVIEQQERHGKLSWRISCFTEHGTVVNEGFVNYQGRRLKGRSQSDLGEVHGRSTVLGYSIDGVRVGECTTP
jgi:hypothetical protein